MDEKGELLWAKKIPKRQICKDFKWYCSFAVIRGENKVILVYNDAKENVDKGLEEATSKYEIDNSNGVVVQATIENSKQMLMYAKEYGKYFYGMATF